MTDMLKMGRKALTVGVAATTIAWSMMAATLVAPISASAAGCTAGSLIKGSLSAVYYCGSDGKRYVFPNEKTYMTWYSDFSSVVRISDADLAALQIGGNVTYRPGVKMVKITTSPTVYAISKGGVLRPVASEAAAVALYGSNWNTQIDDVSDAFFTNYTVGTAVASSADFDKSAEMSAAQSINGDKNLGSSTSSSGSIMVAVAADGPVVTTLPLGAMSVDMLKFTLTNNASTDATVANATVKRVGPGSYQDFSAVYIYEGASRLTTGRSFNSSTNEANFTGLNLVVAAGQSRTLWIAADVAVSGTARVSDVNHFELTSVQAGAATLGGLPVAGPDMTLSGASVGKLTITKTGGTITNPKVGQTNVKVAAFNVDASGSSEDVWFQRITLYQSGNLTADKLMNLKLEQAGNVVATATSLDSKSHAVFNLASPMLIEKGASKTFEVWADIGGSARINDTIALYVEEDSDVYGVGSTYGQGVSVDRSVVGNYDGTSCTSSAGDCSYSTIQGGKVTMTFNGPASKNVASNGKGVEIFNFTMAAQANVEVKKLDLTVTCTTIVADAGGCYKDTGSTPNYTNIKIADTATGQVWWGPADLLGTGAGLDAAQVVKFTDIQDLAAGSTHTFKVTADVARTVPNGDKIAVSLNVFDNSANGGLIRNLDNNTDVATSDIVPSGAISGNTHTIVTPSLAISMSSSPVSQSFVKGSTSVPFVGINLKAGDGTDVKVTSIQLTGYVDGNGAHNMSQGTESGVSVSDSILSCSLFDGSTQVGDSASPGTGTDGTLQFNSLSVVVASASTKSLVLKCDTSNSAVAPERLGFSLPASGVSAQDVDGNSLTPTGSANTFTAPGTTPVKVTITASGSMTYVIAPDDTESQAGLVVAGNSSVVLAKVRLTASNEELKQTKLHVDLANAGSYTDLASMSLYDGSTLVAGPVSVDSTGGVDFTGMSLVVPKDSSKTITIKGALNAISNGAVTGHDLQVIVRTGTGLEYRGTNSSTVATTTTSGDVPGRSKLVRKTIPTVSLASLPTSIVSNGGGIVLARFTVTADAAENISLKKLAFKVSMNGTTTEAVSSPAIREVGQGSDISSSTQDVDTVAHMSACGFNTVPNQLACVRIVFANEQVISAGTSKTYELRMTTANFTTSGDSVSTILLGDSANAVGHLTASALGVDNFVVGTSGEYNFVWSDNSVIAHSDVAITGSADWTNGNLVKNLPTDAQTMTRS
jgi:hypothetical protein